MYIVGVLLLPFRLATVITCFSIFIVFSNLIGGNVKDGEELPQWKRTSVYTLGRFLN